MSSTNSFEENWIETMAVSLEDQLSVVYPRGPVWVHPNDAGETDANNSSSMPEEEIHIQRSLQQMVDELPYPRYDYDGLKSAFATAVENWKVKTEAQNEGEGIKPKPSNSKTKSFSLLDQFSGGFAPPVSLEEIQDATTPEDRLVVFRKIQYLEDLLMDWKDISPLLNNDLADCSATNPHLALEFVALHRKWFDQGRSSPEYTPLLYGICQNLLKVLIAITTTAGHPATTNQTGDSSSLLLISLVRNWRDMWLDLMQRDQYSEDLAEEMEQSMIRLFVSPRTQSSESVRLAQIILSKVDPCARWFHSWTNLVQDSDRIRSLVLSSSSETDTANSVLSELWSQRQGSFSDTNNGTNNWLFHSVAVVSILLCRFRLSQFPWKALRRSTESGATETNANKDDDDDDDNNEVVDESIHEMLNWFLRTAVFFSRKYSGSSNADDRKTTVLNGVEAILAGSYNTSDFDRHYKHVLSTLQDLRGDKVIIRFLETQRKQYDQ